MITKRGRPRLHDEELIVSAILKYKENLINTDNKTIVSKNSKIWMTISHQLNNVISTNALYTLTVKNRFGLKDQILGKTYINQISELNVSSDFSSSKISAASPLNESDDTNYSIKMIFGKSELENLIITKQYTRSEKSRPYIRFRKYEILQPGMWQQLVTEKLWSSYKIKCGYNFKRNKVYNNIITIEGKCNCGSVINGVINNVNLETDNIMNCTRTKGTGICGKRFLRNPERLEIGKMLWDRHLTSEVYKAERAEELMAIDDPEPPHLYKAKTLRNVKQEYSEYLCFDKDPLKSLLIGQETTYKNMIHNLGLNPFFVHYWSNHQIAIYREYAARCCTSVAIDATGSVVTKLNRPNNNKSKHIFLYACVLNATDDKNFIITQMISECQTTNAISFWLMEWLRAKIPVPKEVTCDGSKALLTAVVRIFNSNKNIDEYIAKCWKNDMPICYVRIDVAHFIKGYATFLSGINPRVKTFFLKCIGQLILAQTLQEAELILRAIIVISQSETEGSLPDGTPTLCEIYKEKMKIILTDSVPLEDVASFENNKPENDKLDIYVPDVNNAYGKWANEIYRKLLNEIIDNGDRANAHFYPSLVDRIMRDIKMFPLWSCISVKQFGYGRIPASSAVVESEFNNIKCRLFANALPTRADLLIFRHLDYISGRMKIVDAHNINVLNEKEKSLDKIEIASDISQNLSRDTSLHINTCLCKSENKPSNKNLCIACNTPVHISEECSKIFDSETYGKQRICTSCQHIPKQDILNAIDSNNIENWRGLALKSTKKKSTYLDKNEMVFDLKETRLKNIPILRNGNNINLKAITIKGKKISVIHTCGFDSIFQTLLIALFQSEHFKTTIVKISDSNLFLQIILDAFKNGLTKHTYYLRGVIVSDIFEAKETYDNCFIINCEVSLGYLCNKLFYNIYSIKEITSCNVCKNMREKLLPTIQVKLEDLLNQNYMKAIEDSFILKPKHCHQKKAGLENTKCTGTQSTNISDVGKYLKLYKM